MLTNKAKVFNSSHIFLNFICNEMYIYTFPILSNHRKNIFEQNKKKTLTSK